MVHLMNHDPDNLGSTDSDPECNLRLKCVAWEKSNKEKIKTKQLWFVFTMAMSNVKCLFIVVMRLATLASSQACHSN